MRAFLRRFLTAPPFDFYQLGLIVALLGLLAWNVGTPVLHVWDEARLAVNAAEMLRSGDWLVVRYAGQPDLWNTKPPLLIWLQAGSLQVLGYSMWAFRLPSVLAALGTAWLLYRFGRYTLSSRFVGSFAALILASSPGFNGTHVARFGDYDALLCLALTAAALSWYRYAQQRQAQQLWLGAGWFALALLTKSAAALLLLPCLAGGLLVQPAGRWVFGQWRTYGAIALAFGPLVLFYGLREASAPGYLAATWFNDWYGRLSQRIVTVNYPWWIYFQRLLFPGLLTWVLVLPAGILVGIRASSGATAKHRFARFASVYSLLFLGLVSVARTRLPWYSAPVYPMGALLCALGLEQLAQHARRTWHWPRPVVAGLLALAVAGPAALLLHHEWGRWEAEKTDSQLRYGYLLPQVLAARPGLRALTIILRENEYDAPLLFYAAALHEQGIQPVIVKATAGTLPPLQPGRQVLICDEPLQRYVLQHYETRPLAAIPPSLFITILGRK
ncbi:MAG: glycosyltransferase family 39 protein [Bacteroidota bacterium]|nr:glycosyltransferase family 39 protein [Bacteroidota bacterium]